MGDDLGRANAVEDMAQQIYAAMSWAVEQAAPEMAGKPAPEWVEGGNSLAQDEARAVAEEIIVVCERVIHRAADDFIKMMASRNEA